MSHHCHSGSCSCGNGHSNSPQGCPCDCHKGCKCACHKDHSGYADQLLRLADDAWMEVLKDKIKQEILQQAGDHLNKMAKLVAETNHKRWSEKLAEKECERSFDERLKELMYRHKH